MRSTGEGKRQDMGNRSHMWERETETERGSQNDRERKSQRDRKRAEWLKSPFQELETLAPMSLPLTLQRFPQLS